MFEAYSFTLNHKIKIEDVKDLKEEFGCLNLKCQAKFKAISVNGKKPMHFRRLKNTSHIKGCPYNISINKYINSSTMVKSSVLNILNGASTSKSGSSICSKNKSPSTSKNKSTQYIRTPKQLLNFCLANKLETTYLGNITVDDIILCSRNIKTDARFEGITGLRLLLGNNIKIYIKDNYSIIVFDISAKTKSGSYVNLKASAFTTRKQGEEIETYLKSTFPFGYEKESIAVLGDWETTKKYHVKCNVSREPLIIYRFTNNL